MKKDDVVIFSYTRAQAIADGVLIDATELAKQAGFRYPGRGHGWGMGRVRRGARRAWPDRTRPAGSGMC